MRRILIVVLATVVAIVGGVVTFSYAAGADARAMAGMQPTRVLVVDEAIPAGTPIAAVAESITAAELPATAIVPGALQDLQGLTGMVTTADLEPGEQLLASRFAAPDTLGGAVEVPDGMHLISFQVEPRRVVGGDLEPGDRIAVFVSEGEEGAPDATRLLLHSVLVVDVAGGTQVIVDDASGAETESEPAPGVTVTVALASQDAQQLVFSAEYELIYVSIEPDTADQTDYGLLRDVIGE